MFNIIQFNTRATNDFAAYCCPNVCFVIHWGPSVDIEQYVQETGRAGRDGLPAEAVLYYVGLKGLEVDESMLQYVRMCVDAYCFSTS